MRVAALNKPVRLLVVCLVASVSALRAQTLSQQDVEASVRRAYPPLLAALQDRNVADADALSARGKFDAKLKGKAENNSLGYYENRTVDVVVEQPLRWNGADLFAGWRIGQGTFPVYEGKYDTRSGGEYRVGARLPLLQDRGIDARRVELQKTAIAQQLAGLSVEGQRLAIMNNAIQRYWLWVAAGNKLALARGVLQIAQNRQSLLDIGAQSGQLPAIEAVDNRRSILQREGQVVDAERSLQAAALDLSLFYRDSTGQPIIPGNNQLPAQIPQTAFTGTPNAARISRRVLPKAVGAAPIPAIPAAEPATDLSPSATSAPLGATAVSSTSTATPDTLPVPNSATVVPDGQTAYGEATATPSTGTLFGEVTNTPSTGTAFGETTATPDAGTVLDATKATPRTTVSGVAITVPGSANLTVATGTTQSNAPYSGQGAAPNIDASVALAQEQRPDARRYAQQRAQAQVDLKAAQNLKKPDLDFTTLFTSEKGTSTTVKRGPQEFRVGLNFEMPVQRRYAEGRIRAAESRIEQYKQREQFAKDSIREEVQDALSALNTTAERVRLAAAELALTKQLEDAERTKYDYGEGTLFLLNLREQATLEAAQKNVTALADHQRAVAAYRYAIGDL